MLSSKYCHVCNQPNYSHLESTNSFTLLQGGRPQEVRRYLLVLGRRFMLISQTLANSVPNV